MIKTITFIFSLLCFLIYLYSDRRKGKRREYRNQTETEKSAYKATKKPIREKSALYVAQLETLYKMREEAKLIENRAEDHLKYIRELNQYGTVISEKTEEKAQRTLFMAQKKRLSIENQIIAIEKTIERS